MSISAPPYVCNRCSQTFFSFQNKEDHYFCKERTEEETSLDEKYILYRTGAVSLFRYAGPTPRFRYADNPKKFYEWMHHVKTELIYKETSPVQREAQAALTVQELLSLSSRASYIFKECVFLIPYLNREDTVKAFKLLTYRFIYPEMEVMHVDAQILLRLCLAYDHQWSKEGDLPSIEGVSFPLRILLKIHDEIPKIALHPNPKDPEKYQKLTVEIPDD